MTQRILSIMSVGLGILALIAGCGNGSGSGESAADGPALTKQQFIEKADTICEEAENEEVDLIVAYRQKHPHTKEVELYEPALFPPLHKQIEGIEALNPPSEMATASEQWLHEFETDLEGAEADLSSVGPRAFKDSNRLAKQAGLTDCSHVP